MFLTGTIMLNVLLQRTKEFVRKKFEDTASPNRNLNQELTPHTMNCTLTDDEIKELTYASSISLNNPYLDFVNFANLDIIRTIKDPEKPETLEELNVVKEELISVESKESCTYRNVTIGFTPTVPHCNLAGLIGLCIKVKLNRYFRGKHIKLNVYVTKGSHAKEAELNKQINDKERVAAAMENPDLKNIVENCIREED